MAEPKPNQAVSAARVTALSPASSASLPPAQAAVSGLFRGDTPQKVVGRYALFSQIARGGMGTVHLGRLVASAGFERVVAIKRVHPELMREHEFLGMFRDEIRIAARVQHPNVVAALDVVEDAGELWLVMEYVHGAPLAQLQTLVGRGIPPRIAASILVGMLQGLHAAHEAKSASGEPLGIVHRDVSPQNVLVGCDGLARVLDFGVAKAASQLQRTIIGQIKGKFSYLAPERLVRVETDRRVDVYGAAVVAVEMLLGHKLFDGPEAEVLAKVLKPEIPPLAHLPGVSPAFEALLLKGLATNPNERFQTAAEMAVALHAATELAPAHEVGAWVQATASSALRVRARCLADLEATPASELLHMLSPDPGNATQVSDAPFALPAPVQPSKPSGWRQHWRRGAILTLAAALLCFSWARNHGRNARPAFTAPALAQPTPQIAAAPAATFVKTSDSEPLPAASALAPAAPATPVSAPSAAAVSVTKPAHTAHAATPKPSSPHTTDSVTRPTPSRKPRNASSDGF